SVAITVTPNSLPVANGDIYGTISIGFAVSAAYGVLANDADPQQEPLSAILDVGPANGTLIMDADGSFEYHPNQGFVGYDSFAYHDHAPDGRNSAVAVVQLVVLADPV